MSQFRELRTHERNDSQDVAASQENGGRLVNNFRSIQPLHDRIIRSSFLWGDQELTLGHPSLRICAMSQSSVSVL